jgi:cytochrome c5
MIRRLYWWRQAALVVATAGVATGLALALLPGAVVVHALQDAPAADAAPLQSVWDGVYTEDQARRGEAHYGRSCESCHGADLSGNQVDEIPALAWDAFLLHWNDKTLKDLFESIKRSMPLDKPGSLNARAYVDVVAYLLQVNKFPSGAKELSLNPDALAKIVIQRTKKD